MEISVSNGVVVVDDVRYYPEKDSFRCSRCNAMYTAIKSVIDDINKDLDNFKENPTELKDGGFIASQIFDEGYMDGITTLKERLVKELDRIDIIYSIPVDDDDE